MSRISVAIAFVLTTCLGFNQVVAPSPQLTGYELVSVDVTRSST